MKVWFKRGMIGLVAVVIIALVSLAIFLLTFDPNAYKSKLEEIVYERYQRSLVIKGDIELSLFPRIGLSVQDVSLSEHNSPDQFASIASARFAVAIWPLLSNRLVVDHVAVTGFKASVIRDRDGKFNFHDLAQRQHFPAEPSTEGAEAPPGKDTAPAGSDGGKSGLPAVLSGHVPSRADFQIDIAGLDLKNGEIHLYDNKSGAVAHVVKLDLNTGRMTFDQPFDVALKGKLIGDYPVASANIEGQALVRINPQRREYSAQKLNVLVSGLLGPLEAKSATLRGSLAYSAYSRMLSANNLELLVQGGLLGSQPIKDLETSLLVPRLKVDGSRSELKLEKLAFRAKGARPAQRFDVAFDAPSLAISPDSAKSEAIAGTVKLTGTSTLGITLGLSGLDGNAQNLKLKELKMDAGLKQGDRLMRLKVSSPANWNVLERNGRLTAIKGDVKIEASALPNGSFEFPFIGALEADLVKDQVASEINAVLNGSKLDLKVSANKLSDPHVAFDLVADSLDFNTLFPSTVAVAAPPADKKDGAKGATAPAKAAAKPAEKAPAAKAPAKAPAPSSEEAIKKLKAAEAIDLTMLDSIDLTGKVKVGHIKIRDLEADQFTAALRAAQGKLEVSRIAANLYQGTLSGNLSADSKNVMTAKLDLNGVSVGALLQALAKEGRLDGKGNIGVNLYAEGKTQTALRAGLKGTVQAKVRDGTIKGLDVAQTLHEVNDAVRNVFSGQLPDLDTKFDLGRKTDFTSLDANIEFDRGQGAVKKLEIMAPLLRITGGSPASIDLVNDQLDMLILVHVVETGSGQDGKRLADLKGVAVPIRVSGHFDALNYRVQWKDIASRAVKEAVKDGLIDILSNDVIKGLGPASGKAPAKPEPDKPSNTVKSIGNALKGLLGQ